MARKFIIIAEEGRGDDFVYSPRFGPFEDEVSALAVSKKLNRASTSTFTMDQLPATRRGDDHDVLSSAALDVLHELDPAASPTVRYVVRYIDDFVEPEVTPPASEGHALFRAIRDLG